MSTDFGSARNSRLALGTVQFGLAYGVSNTAGQVGPQAASEILARAHGLGVDLLDTAIAYGSSEQVLGEIGVDRFRIVSKLPAIPEGTQDVHAWMLSSADQSLGRLKRPSLYGLLLHRPGVLSGEHAAAIRQAFRELKASGKVAKTGISIYGPDELDALGTLDDIDIVQSPLNILDTRLIDSGWLDKLHRAKVEVHVRSVFLQGLLLMPSHQRPAYFGQWGELWATWDRWLAARQQTPLEAALRFVLSVDNVERVVVGVESRSHLEQIAAVEAMGGLSDRPVWPAPIDASLLNPSLWKLQ